MLALALFLAVISSTHPIPAIHQGYHRGYEHRYAIVDGVDVTIVGWQMFESYEKQKACEKVEVKRYPKDHVIVSICYE
jgi:hypothetical protein